MDIPNSNSFELNCSNSDSRGESDLFKRSIRLESNSLCEDSQMSFNDQFNEFEISNFNQINNFSKRESNASDISILNESFDKISIISKESIKSSTKSFTGSKISMTGRVLIKPARNQGQSKNNHIERLGCICK